MQTRKSVHVGGCQCGAVRYSLYAEPTNPHVCHCRMCQKASGGYFGAFAGVPLADFAWEKGTPGVFKSSELAERGFCRHCGTPLSFRYVDKDRISVSLGSLDDPAAWRRLGSTASRAASPLSPRSRRYRGPAPRTRFPLSAWRNCKSRQQPDVKASVARTLTDETG